MAKIRESVGDRNIWISIDETTDSADRYVANTIIGTMEAEAESSFSIRCLEKTNASTIVYRKPLPTHFLFSGPKE